MVYGVGLFFVWCRFSVCVISKHVPNVDPLVDGNFPWGRSLEGVLCESTSA